MIIVRGILFCCFKGIGLLCCREKVIKIVHGRITARLGLRVPVFFYATVVGTIIVRAFIAVVRVVALFRAACFFPFDGSTFVSTSSSLLLVSPSVTLDSSLCSTLIVLFPFDGSKFVSSSSLLLLSLSLSLDSSPFLLFSDSSSFFLVFVSSFWTLIHCSKHVALAYWPSLPGNDSKCN
jgi:hypothetical protein